jgi:NADPH-dependent glutamate synthase beta subunit-like oxidoreductase
MCATRVPADEAVVPTFRITARQLEKLPPCQASCPNSGDIRGWVGVIAQHEKNGLALEDAYDQAWLRLAERNPFPATIGRICPHPCEDLCTRVDKDGAVSINAIERFLGDWALDRSLSLPVAEDRPRSESIGVVGSGPASLSFAYQMARRGYAVTVYEQFDVPGGMLRRAIPDYRLPRRVLDAEIERLFDLDIVIETNVDVGTTISLDELRDRHTLLFLGIGAQASRRLGIPGEDGPGVLSGIDYLQRRKTQAESMSGRQVLVIGGGNTAMDAARSLRRDGAAVTVVYRRGESEMPAAREEIEAAKAEGVAFSFLLSPTRVLRDGEDLRGLEVQPMMLGDPDDQGRRRPIPLEVATLELSADLIIVAVAQAPDWHGMNEVIDGDGRLAADEEGRIGKGIWAGGDDRGAGLASTAIAQGRYAAEAAHAELRGLPRPGPDHASKPLQRELVRTGYYEDRERGPAPRLPADHWRSDPEGEIDQTMSDAQVFAEAQRCLSCGLCFDCRQCFMYCNGAGFTRVEETSPGSYFVLALDACEGCGKCIEICPCGYLEPREE